MKHNFTLVQTALLLTGLAAVPAFAAPFLSGSTGADGAFAPTTNTTIQLPASGVLHYTTVNIPAGVTVKFARNAANTAVVILTTGDVNIAGGIDISGGDALVTKYGLAGDINKGGVGGPGGFDGGRGGLQEQNRKGGTGYGPGGGGGGQTATDGSCISRPQGGGGGAFASGGENSRCITMSGAGFLANQRTGYGGVAYGANSMLPLVGGSGGGGGNGGPNGWSLPGSGGGGGGGALMLVSSGSVVLTGTISARGGNGGAINNGDCRDGNSGAQFNDSGGAGGGGAGGAVRILTTMFSGTGTININGALGGCRGANGNTPDQWNAGGNGGVGRSSVEIVSGGTFSLSAIPTLAITSIGGVPVPPNPSGAGDVTLPGELPNPADIAISASGIPVGTVVKLTLHQPYADKVTANASALAGTLQASTSTGSINIPSGSSVLMASTTYALSVAMGEVLKVYAGGERVEKVSLAAVMGGEMRVTLITVSGKEFDVPAAVLATAQIELG